MDNSKQEEKQSVMHIDKYFAGPYKMSDLSFEIAAMSIVPMREEIGYWRALFQYEGSEEKVMPMPPCNNDLGERVVDYLQPSVRFPMTPSLFNCIDERNTEEIYLQSSAVSPNKASLVIQLMPCDETVLGRACAEQSEIDAYFEQTKALHQFIYLGKQINMQNITDPVQPRANSKRLKKGVQQRYFMSMNEFKDNLDPVGFFLQEDEPYKFFSMEEVVEVHEDVSNGAIAQIEFQLSDKHYNYERSAYTILALVGDVGGFNGALLVFQGFFMSLYSSHLFSSKLAEEIPVRRPRKRVKNSAYNEQSDSAGQQQNNKLTQQEVSNIFNDSRAVKHPFKGTVIRSLLCNSKKICKQDRKLRLRKKALERLDKMLDIR